MNAVDIFNDDEDSDEDWGSDWKRKKREAPGGTFIKEAKVIYNASQKA